MTCFKGHSSSIYNRAINAFFLSQTSEEMEVFMMDQGGESPEYRMFKVGMNKLKQETGEVI